MLKKRLAGVITVRKGWAVQSFGYSRYLPLGRPECLAENLDRWGVDEIFLFSIDRTVHRLGPDFDLIRRIGTMGLSTPLVYGGGVSTAADAAKVVQLGAERVCVDAVLHDHPKAVREMAWVLGSQALVASLPVCLSDNAVRWYNYQRRSMNDLSAELRLLVFEGVVSEVFLIDYKHEGLRSAFDPRLVDQFPIDNVPLIAFGGLSEASQLASVLARDRVAAVAIGNFLNYTEHAVQKYRGRTGEAPLRPAAYARDC